MVKVKGVEAVLITAESYKSLLKTINDELRSKEGYNPDFVILNKTQALIYFDEVVEPQEEWEDRNCCECGIYEWNKGCPYREGRVTLMMKACEHFTIEIQEAKS